MGWGEGEPGVVGVEGRKPGVCRFVLAVVAVPFFGGGRISESELEGD